MAFSIEKDERYRNIILLGVVTLDVFSTVSQSISRLR